MERLRISADGLTVAVGADDRCRVFDVRTRREIFATPKGSGMSFLAFSPDGKLLASARWGGHHVDVWNLTNHSLLKRLRADPGLTDNAEPAFSPDGQRLVTVGGGASIMWKVDSWERLWTRPRADLAYSGFSPNRILSNSTFATIGGGVGNMISTNAGESTIAGGNQNTIHSNGFRSVIGGGYRNFIALHGEGHRPA